MAAAGAGGKKAAGAAQQQRKGKRPNPQDAKRGTFRPPGPPRGGWRGRGARGRPCGPWDGPWDEPPGFFGGPMEGPLGPPDNFPGPWEDPWPDGPPGPWDTFPGPWDGPGGPRPGPWDRAGGAWDAPLGGPMRDPMGDLPPEPQPLLPFKRKRPWGEPGLPKEGMPPPSASPPPVRAQGNASLEKMRKLLQTIATQRACSEFEMAMRHGSPPEQSHPRPDLRIERGRSQKREQLQEEGGWWRQGPKLGEGEEDGGERGSPERDQKGHRSPTHGRERWGSDEDYAEEEEETREGSPEQGDRRSPSGSESPPVPIFTPKSWTPCEQVQKYWATCQKRLEHKTKETFISVCPRPSLPDKTSETPRLNDDIAQMLTSLQEKELRSATHTLTLLQREVLDMLGPVMTICEMAEEALEKKGPIDPMELREWSRRVLRYIGSLNCLLNMQRRTCVLGVINPRLKSLSSKVAGGDMNGMLFAEDKVKLLNEIMKRFPQLIQTRKYQPFVKRNNYTFSKMQQKKKNQGFASQHQHGAFDSRKRSQASRQDSPERF